MSKLWQISTTEAGGDQESLMRRGNVYQIANGYMGYRGTLDEFGPEQAVGITLAGLYDRVGDAWREPVNAPNGGFTRVTLEGVELSALGRHVKRHRQTLHFASAVFERETEFRVRGKTLTLHSVRFLSAATPNLGVIQFSVRCDRAADVTIRTGIDGNIWDLNGPHLPDLTAATRHLPTPAGGVPARSDECSYYEHSPRARRRSDERRKGAEAGSTAGATVLTLQGRTHELGKCVIVAEAVDQRLGVERCESADRRHLRVIELRLEPGRTYTFNKYFAVVTANDRVESPVDAAVEMVDQAQARGYAACRAAHDAEWRRRWEQCDVQIEGDDAAQHALRYSILQLLMVAPVPGSANSIPARALSGQVYKGAIFWDTEMFMFPFFLHAYPEKAVELLRYRIRTLEGARRKARTEGPGYRGAFYAWESQETGDDACTYFNIGDPFTGRDLRTHFRDKQVHISGDVAIAIWEYFRITGDDSLLLEGGAEVILECARFYYSYAYFKPEKQRYEILDVIGPDEYHERVNNNAFTSMVAKETFAIANATVAHLRRRHPRTLRVLLKKLKIAPELPAFREAAARLFVPAPDPRTGVIEQFDGYFGLRDATVAELNAQKVHPNEYLGAGQGLAVPTKVIKQADVVMMLNLFKSRFSSAVKQGNWEYYEPRTEHGSSLSACAYAMVATEFGQLDFAYQYFLKTARIDLEAKYKVYVGTVFMGGSHPAANGGAWMTAVLGFAGVQIQEDCLRVQPRLPRKWKSLQFSLAYRGDRFRLKLTPTAVQVAAERTNRRAQMLCVGGRKTRCRPGAVITIRCGRTARAQAQ